MNRYLAIDIGASSGRHIVGWQENGQLKTREVYRFPNGAVRQNGHLTWDIAALEQHVREGIARARAAFPDIVSLSIDTWGVDYVLLRGDEPVLPCFAYRDSRTAGMDAKLREILTEEELYARTGIQKQIFNTIYQLLAVKEQEPELLEKAEHLLMIPDYLHFLLTGQISAEYTNASTTQLLDAKTRSWDFDLIDRLGVPRRIFGELRQPGYRLGSLSPEVREEVGFDCDVVLPSTHDTGSAVLAVPAEEKDFLFLSSGFSDSAARKLKNF